MHWATKAGIWFAAAFQALAAALALPVVGMLTGRVVGDYFVRGELLGLIGLVLGVLAYLIALASSYDHLRYFYQSFEPPGVRNSWALALAIEVATFYMSFSYVILGSTWALWGSILGAFIVFWGNFNSMVEGRLLRHEARRREMEREQAPTAEALPQPALQTPPPAKPSPQPTLQSPQAAENPPKPAERETAPPPPPRPSYPSLNGGHEQIRAKILEFARMGVSREEIMDRLGLPEKVADFHLFQLAQRGLVRLEGNRVFPNE